MRDTSRKANDEKTEQNDAENESIDDAAEDWDDDLYDWDSTRANVLTSIDENGKINEVVYERNNGRGQVRRSKLGNAAMVYVSVGFTYVMSVAKNRISLNKGYTRTAFAVTMRECRRLLSIMRRAAYTHSRT